MTPRVFSIVVPCYFNELNLSDTVPQLLALRERLPGYRLELVFVDDGSGDRTLDGLLAWREKHPDVIKVVKLTRNFGTMAAVQAAFRVVTGDCVGLISADLQDPPELFVEMVGHWERGIKAVFAVRADREEPLLQKAFSNTFYALLRRMAIRHYPRGGFDFFVIDRQVVNEINQIGEKNTNVMTLAFWIGHAQLTIPYVRRRRTKGKSRWTMSKKVKLFIDSFVAFSYAPIRLLSLTGLIVAMSAFAYAGWVMWHRLAHGTPVQGWSSLAVLIAFTAGLQMVMLGVLGEYLWRTLDEARRRPPFFIDEIYDERGRLSRVETERLAAFPSPAVVDRQERIPAGTR
ncbi:MAG TPA: glycosyltransferase family 2 protein [Gemmatimonadaceae bacterium]|nr:glycosyltransferase family 2 protein [Gemmatimonadaceae bacterium]